MENTRPYDLTAYQLAAQRTSSTKSPADKIRNGALGLIGEAGEIVDTLKKMQFQSMPEDMASVRMTEELGDVIWYVAEICAGAGKTIADLDAATTESESCAWNTDVCAVRIVRTACDIFARVQRLEVHDYAAIVVFGRLCEIWLLIRAICDRLNVPLGMVLDMNVRKLIRRYPHGFDAERSNERYEQS